MTERLIGRVLRASTLGFAGAIRLPEPDIPTFGAYCKAAVQRGQAEVLGLIYNIHVDDDLFARQVATAEALTPAQIADHQQNRQVPVEFDVLSVGYRDGGDSRQWRNYHALPPQPPMTLDPIYACAPADIRAFTAGSDFFRIVLNSVEVPADELLAAAIRGAAEAQPAQDRSDYLREAGRELARLLARDLGRLENLLKRIRP
ncbi:MAG: hypothetical protein HY784_18435 [Chloroflexi bacterium]|nr:hypothetical protein [Chloroflexota bacterium]